MNTNVCDQLALLKAQLMPCDELHIKEIEFQYFTILRKHCHCERSEAISLPEMGIASAVKLPRNDKIVIY